MVAGFPRSFSSVSTNSGLVSSEEHCFSSHSPERGAQCAGGPGLPIRPNTVRVVPGPRNFLEDMQTLGHTSSGLVCHKGKQPVRRLCVSLPRQDSVVDGRIKPGLERLGVNLPLPSLGPPTSGCSSSGNLQRNRLPDRSVVAHQTLVSSVSQEVQVSTPSSGEPSSVSIHDGRQGVLQPDQVLLPSRLGTVRKALRKKFSISVTEVIINRLKPGSKKNYQHHWSLFLSYLRDHNISDLDVTLSTVLEFLNFHATHKNRAYRTVAAYRCALVEPLKRALNLDINSLDSEWFMSGLYASNPPRSAPMPVWKLSDLLEFLRTDRFEPLAEVAWTRCIQKALILILLATGRRIHEISFMAVAHKEKDGDIHFSWLPGFRPKWDSADFNPEPPSISPIDKELAGDDLLCPVRAWSIVRERRELVPGYEDAQYFWNRPLLALTTFVRQVVKDSIQWKGVLQDLRIGPHQFKKLACSYALSYHVSSDEDKKRLIKKVGNKSIITIEKSYRNWVSPCTHAFVGPLGTVPGNLQNG